MKHLSTLHIQLVHQRDKRDVRGVSGKSQSRTKTIQYRLSDETSVNSA